MATILYRNAVLLVDGADLSAQLHELAVEYSAETLDATTMGADTRIKKGGLLLAKISGKGYFDSASPGYSDLFFPNDSPTVSSGQIGLDDVVFVVFPDGVIEGSVLTGIGFAMKGVLSTFNIGGTDGQLLDITFAAESRGVSAPGGIITP